MAWSRGVLQATWGDTANSQLAEIYAQRGDADRAFCVHPEASGAARR